MPWVERDRMSLRKEFVEFLKTHMVLMTELCQRLGISRKTGYQWVQRFRAEPSPGWRTKPLPQ